MRYTLLFLVLPMGLGAAQLQIDHVTVCGPDVKRMQAALTAIGIPSEYGGPHSNHATEMALTSFSDGSYMEQIAIQPQGEAKAIDLHEWSKQMRGNAGPCAFAVRPTDMAAEVTRLQSRIKVTAPERAGRDRPDGTRLDWETSQVGTMVRGTYFPFLIHDYSPREARAFPSGKPTTAEFSGVAKVVIAVRNLKDAIALYRETYELPEPERQTDQSFGANLAWFEGTPVILAAATNPPAGAQSWLATRIELLGESPCALILKGSRSPGAGTKWFGTDVSWFDAAKLGWRLGVE